jgi:nicotinamidase-related amidase
MASHAWLDGLSDKEDIIEVYDHYLRKNADGKSVVQESLSLNAGETASLVVVDMQNDFMLSPIGTPPGRFSVGNGESMAPKLAKFIRDNAKNLTKIIYTRDTHPIDHCSFFTNGGPFPPHCVINHPGAALHPSMKALKGVGNSEVVFKGHHEGADSFGAFRYVPQESANTSYLVKRELGKCCPDGLCNAHTGGFYLKNKSKSWDDAPFGGVFTYKETVNQGVLTSADLPDAVNANINNQVGKAFELKDILPAGGIAGKHYIFVCGLAGDYCVKDTAINLRKEINAQGLAEKVHVVVLQPFTRYALLPLEFVGGMQVYSDAILADPAGNPSNFTNIKAGKDINHYLFALGATPRLLTKEQTSALAGENLKKSGVGAFLTPTKDIIDDYVAQNITICMTPPDLTAVSSMMGGARRNRNRSNKRTRNNKRNNRRTRNNRRQ